MHCKDKARNTSNSMVLLRRPTPLNITNSRPERQNCPSRSQIGLAIPQDSGYDCRHFLSNYETLSLAGCRVQATLAYRPSYKTQNQFKAETKININSKDSEFGSRQPPSKAEVSPSSQFGSNLL